MKIEFVNPGGSRYHAPAVERIAVAAERGFAITGDVDDDSGLPGIGGSGDGDWDEREF